MTKNNHKLTQKIQKKHKLPQKKQRDKKTQRDKQLQRCKTTSIKDDYEETKNNYKNVNYSKILQRATEHLQGVTRLQRDKNVIDGNVQRQLQRCKAITIRRKTTKRLRTTAKRQNHYIVMQDDKETN